MENGIFRSFMSALDFKLESHNCLKVSKLQPNLFYKEIVNWSS